MAGPTASVLCPESFDRLTFRDALKDVVSLWHESDFFPITDDQVTHNPKTGDLACPQFSLVVTSSNLLSP